MEELKKLVIELCKNTDELPWLEFKHNNYDPDTIGETVCALANGAILSEKNNAYMLWGIDDKTHRIIGTNHNLHSLKKGGQELENWLRTLLSDNMDFSFETVVFPEGDVGVMTIQRPATRPASFKKTEYIRVGSYTKKLRDYPELQERLWKILQNERFEERVAKQDLSLQKALGLLDFTAYFDRVGIPVPTDQSGIAHYLIEEGVLIQQDNGMYSITNLGAILFAKSITDFDRLSRKALRIVQYEGKNKLSTLKDETTKKGYAIGFEEWITLVEALLPSWEVIDSAIREKKTAYPIVTIREAIANALIHQDFAMTGAGVTVEIFSNRIEITNPGHPLVEITRIIDNPPQSRNEMLAGMMRRLGMCEELGTGWDKMVLACELQQLPAPRIEAYATGTRVTLFKEMPFSSISGEDRRWACYLHACVKYVQGDCLTNSSLRERFGLPESSSGNVSRLIRESVQRGNIKAVDPDTAPRYMKYIPGWA